ncbi:MULTISPECIES: DegT/DnrJ/EryC1/StrS aminotransferase family protein [unclassified Synechococcus]|uniref:DegT/DnrJ/EryC1/StrS family aminotransferase n=1 Tax=unclassified Synechococcus TaxID=2626047 RepID=UPI0020CF3C22|nr:MULTISPECIES: DegT/DnrJ/EryC1/StrS aminotransferase family protein [unclassified Synechococcus]
MSDFIPVNEPVIGDREKELVMTCLNTGWISSEGPFVSQFEESFSRRVGRKHGVACSNGTAALDLAVAALRLGPGDEVILPTFTIISCAAAIVRAGATPVVVDADPVTWNMVPEQVAAAVTPRTAAIMVVHIYGLPVDMDPILELAERHQLAVIEDAAELIGGTYKGRPCGSFGHISTFSFYPNKHITTGEGGMVVTDDHALADRCRSLRNLCFQPKQRFVHEELGWNYRMTNLQAALGLGQLESLDQALEKKRSIGHEYTKLLSKEDALQLPHENTVYAQNLYWVFGVILKNPNTSAGEIMGKLGTVGIGTRPFFFPIHKQPVFLAHGLFINEILPIAEMLSTQGFYLPSGLALTTQQINVIAPQLLKQCTPYPD